MADADKKTKVRIQMETVVDEKQIKQEVETAQKVADANKVIIPVKTEEIVSEDMKQEVKAVQKEVSKTPVEIPVKLTHKDMQNELNKLVKQKGKSQEEVKAKLDELMKGMDLSDVVKDSIKDLFLKYRSMSNSKKGFSSASTKSKDDFINIATNFSKKTQSKKSNALVRALTELTAGQAQAYRNERSSTDQLRKSRENIYNEVSAARAKQDAARDKVKKSYYDEQKAAGFVEGRVDPEGKITIMKEVYRSILDSLADSKAFAMAHTDNGKNKKAVEYWGSPDSWDPFIKVFEDYLNKGLMAYQNRDNIVPEARAEYENVTKELEAIEAEAVKRLEEINKILGPVKKLFIDDSFTPPKLTPGFFKETEAPKKFKLRPRTLTDDVADAAINRDFFKKLKHGASRAQSGEPGSDVNLGLRHSMMDGPYVDKKRIIRTAIGGPYADTNSYERLTAETRKASDKLAKETLLKFRVAVNNLSNFLAERNKQLKQEAEKNGSTFIGDEGRNKNDITELEKNRHLSQIATDEAIKELKKINKGKPNANVGAFQDALKASFGFLTKSFGSSIWKGLSQNVNAIMSQFAGGTFKITDDPIKGEGKNYAELAKLLSENFKDINDFFAKNPEMEKLAEAARQLKTAAQIGQDAFEQSLKDNAKILQQFGYTTGRLVATRGARKGEPAVSGNTQLSKHVQNLVGNAEKQINYTKLGNIEGEETTESIKLTDTTGTDSEAGKNEVVKAVEDVRTTVKDTFSDINGNGFGGGNGGNGGSNDLGDTGPSILEQIRDLLVNISAYTTAIFDILPKLKLTIKREKRSKKKDTTEPIKTDNTSTRDSFGASMEINKIWDDIAEQFENFIAPIHEAFLPVVSGKLQDKTDEAFKALQDAGKTLVPGPNEWNKVFEQQEENRKRINDPDAVAKVEKELEQLQTGAHESQKRSSKVELSQDISTMKKSLTDVFKKIFGGATSETEVERLKNLNQRDRERELAERRRIFGIADSDRNASATGDKGRAFRMKSLYGHKNAKNPFEDLQLTPGLDVDTKGITEALQTMIEKNMFSAQTGVNGFGDLIKLSLGGIGMPSLEKSRAQADAANEIMSIIRQAVQELLQAIQAKETDLRGMEARGDATFNEQGIMTSGTDDAWTTFGQLEETKMALNGIIAEMGMMDQLSEATGGNMTEFFKVLAFVSPELKKCNGIIENINAGLDKNGKALKFQKRLQETLNYSFQLLTRHVGQIFKNWMMMLNPINLVKKAFSDFASYDVKWQRTMNVIKYNLRRVIRPFMEWLAQQFVNIIGLVNALMKGLGKAFGQNWDLFDKDAASTEKMREDFEAMQDVSAGFDELHDIGSDATTDLSGDIYTPQWTSLYDTIENFGKKIGDVLNGIKKLTEGWNFWTWLAVIGGALIGLKVLKWLINLFGKGKNPLQSVADGLSFLEKAVGWAVLIWAFTEFTKALTGFVECMKTADWEDITKSLLMLGGAFLELVGSIILLEWGSFGADPKAMVGLASLVWVFGEFVKAIIPFIELMWSICDLNNEGKEFEILAGSLSMLALSFIELIAGVAGMEKLTQIIGLDWQSLFGLAAVVGVFDLFVTALIPFIKTISQIEGDKWDTLIPMIVGLGGAFVALAAGVATVSKFFTAMDWTAIGQFAVITIIFDLFMATLVPFVNAIKDIPFETLAGGATLIAGAFISLGIAVGIMGTFFKGLSLGAFIELIALLAVMGGLIYVITEFAKVLKDLSAEQIYAGLELLAGTIITVSVAIGVLAAVFTALVTTGIGAAAIALLALVLGVVALVIVAIADLVRAIGEAGAGIKLICEGIAGIVTAIGEQLSNYVKTVGEAIAGIIEAIANGIKTVLEPIMDFMDSVMDKVVDLAKTIAQEIGETIRTVIKTVGDVVLGIIDAIVDAIPNLLTSIVNFCNDIGPAIENSVEAIIRSITKLVNFVVSAVEYICNLVIGAINKFSVQVPDWVPGIGGTQFGFNLQKIEIPRFVPQYETGTNYVPNDGLAYLHKGEAVIPKKYNQPYQQATLSAEERAYMSQMIKTMESLDSTMKQGINVNGQFVQRGSDLVATVEKANNRMSNKILSNRVYAR